MFGYIMINRDELKVKEAEKYQAFYCGLCYALNKRHGRFGQATLTYDMTFLVILLNGLYEEAFHERTSHCIVHPIQKHHMIWNEISDYCADMNVLLAYYNLLDDWNDERKLSRYIAAKSLSKHCRQLEKKYSRQVNAVKEYIQSLNQCEKSNCDNIEQAAYLTGKMLAEIFVYREDDWAESMRQIGFFIGKFIYLMDAYEDVEQDMATGSYNPLKSIQMHTNFDDECQNILMMQLSECCRAFERLPIVQDVGILRNILYSGVWIKFAAIYNKRNEAGDKR